jgi:hypothetical protein
MCTSAVGVAFNVCFANVVLPYRSALKGFEVTHPRECFVC